ncbi:type II toxin-antitoxin system VapC family toxin [Actinoallomurus sp. NPDC052274]|uniref:type II toxin-antitoxin system VapC family toxin n=1 Tax=Actinoallomurus sp. NPDC052274 TaxID=3155420 RepID=UPI00343395F8
MRLLDVNVLVNAHRREAVDHKAYRAFVDDLVHGDEAYAVSDFVINGFVRVVTNRRVWGPPSSIEEALRFGEVMRNQPHAVVIAPGPRFWGIFSRLCRQIDAKANLVPDAYLAALAIEHGCEFVTADRDFVRFPGLRWRHPLN